MTFYLQMFIPNHLTLYCLPLRCTACIMYEATHPFSIQHCQPHSVFPLRSNPAACAMWFLHSVLSLRSNPAAMYFLHSDLSLRSNPAAIRFLHRHSVFPLRPNHTAIWFLHFVLPLRSNLVVIWFLHSIFSPKPIVFYTLYFLWGQLVFTLCTSSKDNWFLHPVLPLRPNPVVIWFLYSVLPLRPNPVVILFLHSVLPPKTKPAAIWFLHSYHRKYHFCSDRSNLFCADTWYFWENSILMVSATGQLILQFMETCPLSSRRSANPFRGHCSNEFWLPRFENCQSMCTQPHTNTQWHTNMHAVECVPVHTLDQ